MAKATYFQRGEALEYINSTSSQIDNGAIVTLKATVASVGRVGVISDDIAAGSTGEVQVVGVFKMPKSSTNAIAQGVAVYFDGNGITENSNSGANTPAGYAAYAAAAADTTISVKIG